ncbi:hypothetical protein [uncultured Psychrobacter sp.]|uniref:hypothetical protein n=1 Tax=uncultured Psychrobacter sp. TaxID=259303 RepID=UPI003457D3A9
MQTVAGGGIEATGTAQTIMPASPRLADTSKKQDKLRYPKKPTPTKKAQSPT